MNTVQLIGRLTRAPEVRYSQGSVPLAVARYTLAVNRAVKKGDEHPEADFISRAVRSANCWPTAAKRPYGCVAFGKNGEFAEKWLKKGMRIGVEGRIQTGIFTDKDGIKRKSFDVIVNKHHFCDSSSTVENGSAEGREDKGAAGTSMGSQPAMDGFYEVNENMDDDDLPF